ncbi:mRNA capping large subunit [Cyclospora cayetanensis]|uniref:mRNA capping large subunit n=1 Tax=Cyclospora cayetanensis TaxID=88456 RepID=A0A1D3D008_9EIME|nr:mRNA capping large subunit [Cyclospora cayetanensis]
MVPSQQQATDLLSRCAGRLVPGGKLIGSTMCCREIVRYVLDLKLLQQPSPDADETDEFVSVCLSRLDVAQGQRVFWAGNSLCALFFEEQTLAPLLHPFRLPTEEDAEEFVFPFKAVRNTAKELGLECCLSVSFPRLLDAAANHPKLGADARAWVRGLRSRRGALLDRQQAETFALYKAFSFRKIDPHAQQPNHAENAIE